MRWRWFFHFPLKKSVSPIFQNGLWEPNTANSTAKLIIILIPIGIIKVYLRILLFYSLEYKMAVEAGRTLLELSLFLVFDLTCLTLYFYLRAFLMKVNVNLYLCYASRKSWVQMFEIMIQNSIICFVLILLIYFCFGTKCHQFLWGFLPWKSTTKYQVCYIYVFVDYSG